jgi:hypothetical protein
VVENEERGGDNGRYKYPLICHFLLRRILCDIFVSYFNNKEETKIQRLFVRLQKMERQVTKKY